MPILDYDPGSSPEAPGTLYFYEQGQDPATGFQATTRGAVAAPGGMATAGALQVTGTAATSLLATGIVGGDTFDRVRVRVDGRLDIGPGTGARDTNLYRSAAATLATDGSLVLAVAGAGLKVKEGTNATMGTATLVAGTVAVSTTAVTANSRVFLTAQNTGGTPGALRVSARTPGTSFTITSTSGTDTSAVAWWIVEPAP